jgi:hypothetical protein
MPPLRLSLFVALLLLAPACGTPKAGEKCDTAGYLCADATTALECRVGLWVSLPCRGVNGCTRSSELVKCDMSGNDEGDACASSAVGKGLCTADKLATLECRDDGQGFSKLVKTHTCRSCVIQGDNVVCQ